MRNKKENPNIPFSHKSQIITELKRVSIKIKKDLEEILCLLSEVCDTPIALITLMNESEQWFICARGTTLPGNSVEKSFCQYLSADVQILEINNAAEDERFKDLEAVKDFGMLFYAGSPLLSNEGLLIGSVCVFDQRVRVLTEIQKNCLTTLSRQIGKQMEMQRIEETNKTVTAELKSQKEQTESLLQKLRAYFDSSPSLHILLDLKMNVLDFNSEAVSIVSKYLNKEITQGESILNYISADYAVYFQKFYRRALRGKRVAREVQIRYDNTLIWWRITLRPVINDQNEVVAIAYSAMNIHQTREHLEEITRQNRSLQKIAMVQSHEYRKPVASILGLLQLIKQDQYKMDSAVFDMLQTAVQDLDEQMKKVVKYSEGSL